MYENKLDISMVIPLINEEESLEELYNWIKKVVDIHQYTYEVIFVDDGSSDTSWQIIKQLTQQDPQVKGISFNRNYGKSAALHVGFQAAQGSIVITMDADLQDDPEEIPELYQMINQQGYDLVSGWKQKRQDPLTKTIPTKLFNAVTRAFSGIRLHDFNCGLKAYKIQVVKNVEVYGEMHRYIPVLAKWAGFKKIGEKKVKHHARKYGFTKFGLERFMYGFLDLLSIIFVSKFRKRPMHFFGSLGFLSFLIGLFITIWIIIEKWYNLRLALKVRPITDQPLFFLALVAIIVGVQLFLAGFLGEMITINSPKTHDYLIKEKIGK